MLLRPPASVYEMVMQSFSISGFLKTGVKLANKADSDSDLQRIISHANLVKKERTIAWLAVIFTATDGYDQKLSCIKSSSCGQDQN